MIDALFAYAGGDDRYNDAFGAPAIVSTETKLAIVRALGYDVHDDASAVRVLRDAQLADARRTVEPVYALRLGAESAWPAIVREALPSEPHVGYHALEIEGHRTLAIVAPPNAYVAEALERESLWGVGAQVYALRSARNWGIGDFADLAELVRIAASSGASTVGVNPLHQLHLTNPESASPYAPLSRRFLNALYISVPLAASMLGARIEEPSNAHALRESALIAYADVARVKLEALDALVAQIDAAAIARAYESERPDVRRMAVYEAIMEWATSRDPHVYGWQQWPAELRDCASDAVAAFARERAQRVDFFIVLQWLADRQLGLATEAAPLSVGLYRDLAVGVDVSSVDVWSDPHAYALDLAVGAPPDPLNPLGQNWGLPPLNPRILRERAYEPFIALLRANMRHAGALRIDHVMGLQRLFCIPRTTAGAAGAYLQYDMETMLAIVATESHLNRCTIVGEDLGTVPEGFRERLAPERIFSCRVLFFEREADGRFRSPDAYPRDAVASTGTHDLPPLAGYWSNVDIVTRERLGWIDAAGAEREAAEHASTRRTLLAALVERGCLDPDAARRLEDEGASPSSDGIETLVSAVYRYLARGASRLVLVQLEDAIGEREQVNVPGTVQDEPNWRRRLPVALEALQSTSIYATLASALRAERSSGERVA